MLFAVSVGILFPFRSSNFQSGRTMGYFTGRQESRQRQCLKFPLALFLGLACTSQMMSAAEVSRSSTDKLKGREALAAKLVDESLRLRAQGASGESHQRLTQAIAIAPDYAPARWQLGEIRRDKQWASLDDLAMGVAPNASLAEYARQRDAMTRTAAPIWLNKSLDTSGQSNGTTHYGQMPGTATRYLRKRFDLTGRPDWAQLQVQVIGRCEISVNGRQLVHTDGNGWSGIKVISGQLHPGTNVIALAVHAGNEQQVTGVRVWLEGFDHDHAIFAIPSDDSWKVTTDKFDNWNDSEFDDREWESARSTQAAKSGDVLAEEWTVSTKLETALARWCEEHALVEQSRFHWTRILHTQPTNSEAIKALGLQLYAGRLLTPSQVTEAKRDEREANAAMARWYPLLQKLRADLRQGSPKNVERSRKALLEADAAAIPAFEKVLKELAPTDGDPEFVTEFVKTVLARSDELASTAKLSEIARKHPQESVRHEAIEALKDRDLLTFVPDLMGALETPTQVTTSVTSDGKSATYTATYFHPGVLFDEEKTETTRIEPESKKRTVADAILTAQSRARRIEESVALKNLSIPDRNERIFAILRSVTKTDQGDTASAWWQWWGDHNELLIPKQDRVRQVAYFNTEILRSEKREKDKIKDCFSKGTLVWTQSGLRPIETIRVGDAVLAQDVEQGELAFKVVLGTSIRAASPMTRLCLGDETIVSTRGHRYWIDGSGWRMAKSLKQGDLLHGLKQPVNVTDVSESPDEPAWNLIVEGYNSYFVGRQGILVHDSGAPTPTKSIVPGLSRLD